MEKESVRKALEFCVNNPELDLRTFEQSEEYKILSNKILSSDHIGSVYSGLPIIIDGDLESIIISKHNEIALIILYALIGKEKRYARVVYKSKSDVNLIRRKLLPMTHIRLTARFTNKFGEYIGGAFRLFNQPLMYGHFICPDCNYDYGVGKESENQCCEICADEATDKLKYVTDYYRINA